MQPNRQIWKSGVLLLLLAGAVAMGLAGCSRSQPTAAELRQEWIGKTHQVIKDPARARQVAEMIGRLLDAQEARVAALHAGSTRLAALNADYHVTSAQLAAVYEEYEVQQREALTKFRDDLFVLRGQVSASEWEALVD